MEAPSNQEEQRSWDRNKLCENDKNWPRSWGDKNSSCNTLQRTTIEAAYRLPEYPKHAMTDRPPPRSRRQGIRRYIDYCADGFIVNFEYELSECSV